jgi:hypothetical protein
VTLSVKLRGEQRLGRGPLARMAPTLAPDGRRVAMMVGDSWVLTDAKGRIVRALGGPATDGAALSREGALAFGRLGDDDARELWYAPSVVEPALRLLGGDGHDYRHPCFSPEGRTLICAAGLPGLPTQLWSFELGTNRRRKLPRGDDAEGERIDTRPVFSPSGERLFFEGWSGGDRAVWVIEWPEGPVHRLVSGGHPAPLDDERLIVERQRPDDPSGASELWLVELRHGIERSLGLRDACAPSVSTEDGLQLAWEEPGKTSPRRVCVSGLRVRLRRKEEPAIDEPSDEELLLESRPESTAFKSGVGGRAELADDSIIPIHLDEEGPAVASIEPPHSPGRAR